MPETNISSAVVTSNQQEDFSVDTQSTDAQSADGLTRWNNNKWTQYFGYYKTIPELNTTIDARATWTIGKGFTTDLAETAMILNNIRGYGNPDTFNTLLENMIRTMIIAGDSFAEIIRDEDRNFINLKPLDPGSITIVVNGKGLIEFYEQTSKTKKAPEKFMPDKIFHLARNRVADEIHGVSVIEKLEQIILMRNEAMNDYKRVMHRNVDPLVVITADTDNPTKIAKIKRDWEKVKKESETWVVPKGVIVPEIFGVSPNATLDPKTWIDQLNDYFYEAVGVPKVIVGGSKGFTDASEKIVYLAFEQSVKEDQLYIQEQVGQQLGIQIELLFPASLENEVLAAKQPEKPVNQPTEIEPEKASQPNDTTVEMEGNT